MNRLAFLCPYIHWNKYSDTIDTRKCWKGGKSSSNKTVVPLSQESKGHCEFVRKIWGVVGRVLDIEEQDFRFRGGCTIFEVRLLVIHEVRAAPDDGSNSGGNGTHGTAVSTF